MSTDVPDTTDATEPRRRIGIVTDSAAGLPRTVLQAWEAAGDFVCIPMPLKIGEQIHADGSDPKVLEELAVAAAEGTAMSTSRPAPSAFDEAYERLAQAGCEAIVSVHLSAELSGTCDAARAAARRFAEHRPGIVVRVIDTRTVTIAEGFAAAAALGAARRGLPLARVEQAAVDACEESRLLFHVPSLEHLARSGRIPRGLARVGQMFRIQPIATVEDGRLIYVERPRQAAQARARLTEMVLEDVGRCLEEDERDAGDSAGCLLAVHDFFSKDVAEQLERAVQERYGDRVQLLRTPLPPVLGVHTGLGPVCVAAIPRTRVAELTTTP